MLRQAVRHGRAGHCGSLSGRMGGQALPGKLGARLRSRNRSRRIIARLERFDALGSQIVDTLGKQNPKNRWALAGDGVEATEIDAGEYL